MPSSKSRSTPLRLPFRAPTCSRVHPLSSVPSEYLNDRLLENYHLNDTTHSCGIACSTKLRTNSCLCFIFSEVPSNRRLRRKEGMVSQAAASEKGKPCSLDFRSGPGDLLSSIAVRCEALLLPVIAMPDLAGEDGGRCYPECHTSLLGRCCWVFLLIWGSRRLGMKACRSLPVHGRSLLLGHGEDDCCHGLDDLNVADIDEVHRILEEIEQSGVAGGGLHRQFIVEDGVPYRLLRQCTDNRTHAVY
ncbi:hypothetical protein ACLOJK_004229 [Asimina triloba]